MGREQTDRFRLSPTKSGQSAIGPGAVIPVLSQAAGQQGAFMRGIRADILSAHKRTV